MSRRSNRGPPDRSLRADEVYCTSCGEPIKRDAELCPNCGVRNEAAGGGQPRGGARRGQAGRGTPSGTHSASTGAATAGGTGAVGTGETTVTDTWWYGVAGTTGLWVVLIVLSQIGSSLGAVGGLLLFVAWIGLPASAYFDMQYVRANSDWDPNTAIWILVLAIWFVGMVAGGVYLYRRHETLGTP